jgi:hypothetical protein
MRASPQQLERNASQALVDAFARSDLTAVIAPCSPSHDIVLEGPSGPITIELKVMSVATAGRIQALFDGYRHAKRGSEAADVVVVVANELPADARDFLRSVGWGYLDRRGRLWFRADGVLINDTDLPPETRQRQTPAPVDPLRGRVALSIGVWILMHPDEPHGVRGLARELGSAPSTAQVAFTRLRDEALIHDDGRPLIPELFWAVADAWRPERHFVTREPSPNDDVDLLGLASDLRGWAVSGDVAAAAWGAPVPVRSGMPPTFYVPSSALPNALRLLGTSSDSEAGAVLSVAPAAALTEHPYDLLPSATPWLYWPVAHPVIVALDLAQDRSRGREILDEWNPPKEFLRVW